MKIEVYKNNSKSIQCTFTTDKDLTDFTAYLTVADRNDSSTTVITTSADVDAVNNKCVFDLTPADTNIAAGDYVYDITITDGTDIYTLIVDKFQILEPVKY